MMLTADEELQELVALATLEAIAQFCKFAGGVCFEKWTLEQVRNYVKWHAQNDSLRFVQTSVKQGKQVIGAGFAWRVRRVELELQAAGAKPSFKWEPARGDEDALLVAEVVGRMPGVFAQLTRELWRKYPDCVRPENPTPVYTYRRGKLVRTSVAVMERVGELGKASHGRRRR